MANTITSTILNKSAGSREIVYQWVLSSDGSNETATVIHDSSVVATAIGIADPLTCHILQVKSSMAVASTARVKLLFDATSALLAIPIPNNNSEIDQDFRDFGGLKDIGGAGITGDITITTTGLASGDQILLVLVVKMN